MEGVAGHLRSCRDLDTCLFDRGCGSPAMLQDGQGVSAASQPQAQRHVVRETHHYRPSALNIATVSDVSRQFIQSLPGMWIDCI
jgi:hypothetical protein